MYLLSAVLTSISLAAFAAAVHYSSAAAAAATTTAAETTTTAQNTSAVEATHLRDPGPSAADLLKQVAGTDNI